MSLPVVFRTAAGTDYLSASAWYEDHQPGLGAEFEAAVRVVLDTAAQHPDRYAIAHRDVREAPLRRFPYSIFYRVRSGRIVVVAVFHQSRDPAEWQSRS